MYQKGRQLNTSAEPKISPVTLALQLASGERLLKEFEPHVALWDILEHWDGDGKLEPSLQSLTPSQVPVCIYLRKEVSSKEQLKATTLLDLGIMNGKVAIRYNVKSDEAKEQPHVGGVLPRAARPESPPFSRKQKEEIQQQAIIEPSKPAEEKVIPMEQESEAKSEPLIDQPSEMKEQSFTTEDAMEVEAPRSVSSSIPVASAPVQHSEESDSTPVTYLNDRDGHLLYQRPESYSEFKQNEEETDDFFEVTELEVRKMMQDLIRENRKHQNAPLVTSKLRQNQEEERRSQFLQKYPTTILRVQFADGLILQMPLPSQTHLSQVKKELLLYLTEEFKVDVGDFVLFISPPKEVLQEDLPLHELGLTPSSLVYIGSSNSTKICSGSLVVKSEFRQSISSYCDAVRDATRRINSYQRDDSSSASSSTSDFKLPSTEQQRRDTPVDDGAVGAKRPAYPPSSNVPKWLKLKR